MVLEHTIMHQRRRRQQQRQQACRSRLTFSARSIVASAIICPHKHACYYCSVAPIRLPPTFPPAASPSLVRPSLRPALLSACTNGCPARKLSSMASARAGWSC
eukprot:2465549-Pyramimonas_sp.AAC.1